MQEIVDAGSLSGAEALRKYEAGWRVVCPVCGAALQSIPAELPPGHVVSGLVCPKNQQHYLLYGESEFAMKSMRDFMRKLAAKRD